MIQRFFFYDLILKEIFNAKAVIERKLYKISNIKAGVEFNDSNEKTWFLLPMKIIFSR